MKRIFTLLLAAASTVGVMAANDGNVVKYDFENYELIPSGNYSYYAWHE